VGVRGVCVEAGKRGNFGICCAPKFKVKVAHFSSFFNISFYKVLYGYGYGGEVALFEIFFAKF